MRTRFSIMFMLTFFCMYMTSMRANAMLVPDSTSTPLPYILPNPSHSPVGVKRSPANFDCLPETWVSCGHLHFLGTENIPNMGMIIWDEDENIVLSTSVVIVEDMESTIDISNLTSGYYELFVIVDGVVYEAHFEM